MKAVLIFVLLIGCKPVIQQPRHVPLSRDKVNEIVLSNSPPSRDETIVVMKPNERPVASSTVPATPSLSVVNSRFSDKSKFRKSNRNR